MECQILKIQQYINLDHKLFFVKKYTKHANYEFIISISITQIY